MLYMIAILLGILAGLLAKGRISGLLNLRFEKAWIILCAFAMQAIVQILAIKGMSAAEKYGAVAMGASYFLLLLGFWFNRHYAGVLVIGVGCFLNAAVILLNGGKMPVSSNALQRAGLGETIEMLHAGIDGKHTVISASTKLNFLADIMSPPGFLGISMRVISIGDIIVVIGLFLVVFETMIKSRMKKE